jgi:hypothetical protein
LNRNYHRHYTQSNIDKLGVQVPKAYASVYQHRF